MHNLGTLQIRRVPDCQKLRRTVFLQHGHGAPISHAINICLDALLVSCVPRVSVSLRLFRISRPLRKVCCPAQVRLLILCPQREILIGTLLQRFKPWSQAQFLFLFRPAATSFPFDSNRDQAGITYWLWQAATGSALSCSMIAGCLATGTIADVPSTPEAVRTCSCHAAAPTQPTKPAERT